MFANYVIYVPKLLEKNNGKIIQSTFFYRKYSFSFTSLFYFIYLFYYFYKKKVFTVWNALGNMLREKKIKKEETNFPSCYFFPQ